MVPSSASLYVAGHWPLEDLLDDLPAARFAGLVAGSLDADAEGFLLRLSFDVYRLFELTVTDLANDSGPIRLEISRSRILQAPTAGELGPYNAYVADDASTDAAASA